MTEPQQEAPKTEIVPVAPAAQSGLPIIDPAKLWEVAGPYIEKIADAAIHALERSNRHSGVITGLLLALIICCLTGVAVFALYLDKVDTAEKVLIALVSFLGGAAMFSGTPKK